LADLDEIEEQLLEASDLESSNISSPESRKLHEKFDQLYSELGNLDILSETYGIDIPDKDLNLLNMDADLLELYLKQKAAKI
jgi:hypothetical protein